MPSKWADYLITAVRYSQAGTHIDTVQVRADNGDRAGAATTASRTQIVSWIEAGWTFCTATLTLEGLRKGAPVKIIEIDGEPFIRTTPDKVKADNLDELPEF